MWNGPRVILAVFSDGDLVGGLSMEFERTGVLEPFFLNRMLQSSVCHLQSETFGGMQLYVSRVFVSR